MAVYILKKYKLSIRGSSCRCLINVIKYDTVGFIRSSGVLLIADKHVLNTQYHQCFFLVQIIWCIHFVSI